MTASHVLPTKLKRDPLIDAVLEMRFASPVPFASVMTGILYSKLPGEKQIEQLPAAQLPKELRDGDPNLAFAPTIKISWGKFWIFLGDKVFSVACKVPYPGWDEFRDAIYQSFEIACTSELISGVSRYSMKYVDLIPIPEGALPAEAFKLEASVGSRQASSKSFQIRTDIEEPPYIHTIQFISQASVTLIDHGPRTGAVLDVDSVCKLQLESPLDFLKKLSERASDLHSKTKEIFFDCLSDKAVEWLEPTYE